MTDFYMCSTQQCLCMYIILLHTLVTLGNKSSFGLKKKRKKGQKGKHVSSLFKRTQKLVRYIRCFSKHGLCLHFNSFFQQILVYCTSQILYFRGFIIHLSICYHIFSGSVFLHSIPRRLLEDLLFFDLSVMFCFNLFLFGSLFSYSFLIAFIHVFFGFFVFFLMEIGIVRADRKENFISSESLCIHLSLPTWAPFQTSTQISHKGKSWQFVVTAELADLKLH